MGHYAIWSHTSLIHVGYFMKVGSQAKVMPINNLIVTITKGQKVSFEHEYEVPSHLLFTYMAIIFSLMVVTI